MRILVTGASGFVGRHLVDSLHLNNVEVVSVYRSQTQFENSHSFIVPDFKKSSAWLTPLSGCQVVIHLAARVHILKGTSDHAYTEANFDGTMCLADQAANMGVRRFVYVSSVKVNGEITKGAPFTETSPSIETDAYAISKFKTEEALRKLSEDTGMEVVILRPPLVYGAGVKANFLSLLSVVKKGWPLPFLAVNNSRSMIYVENLVDALVLCATHPKAAGNTYLVSDGEDISTPELIKKVACAFNKTIPLIYFPVPFLKAVFVLFGKKSAINRLTQSLVVDSSKIRRELGWSPPFTMDEGLMATADWYLSQIENK